MNRQIYENYILQIMEHGSLTNAAKALDISQPALSQGLNSLEKEIGFKVFNRRTNPITLTAEGELYYKHICRLELLNANFERELKGLQSDIEKHVVIGAPAVYIHSVIVPSVIKLIDAGYQVSIRTASVEQLIELAGEGKVDCFVSTTDSLPNHFEKQFIFQEEIVVCVPENSEISSLDCEEIWDQQFIFLNDDFPLQKAVNQFLADKAVRPKYGIVVDQVSGAVDLVERGIGACFASKEAAEGRRVRTFPVDIMGRNIYLAYDKELYRTKACEELIHFIVGKGEEHE